MNTTDRFGTKIRNRSFRTPNDILAAKRDERRIIMMEESMDETDYHSVEKVYRELKSGRIPFETLLGEDFLEEVEHKLKTLPKEQATSAKKRSRSKKAVTQKGKISAPKEKKIVTRDKNTARKDKGTSRKASSKKSANQKQSVLDSYSMEDPILRREIQKELKKQKRKRKLLTGVLSLVASCCLGYVIFYYAMYEKNQAEYEELADLKDDRMGGSKDSVSVMMDAENRELPPILAKYEKLYQKNKKIVGWISIDGTKIDYPVMQTVNNEYYLDHNYNQEYDKNGSIFMDKDCTPAFPNTNMIIYGHHMKSGRMFGDLNRYSKKEYYEKHPSIRFDTIYEEGLYDIMYVFRSRIYNADEVVFKYYQFIDVNSADEFYSAMDEMSRMALYDTGVTAEYGDKLITLSTCDNSETDGRFVVVAKKMNGN